MLKKNLYTTLNNFNNSTLDYQIIENLIRDENYLDESYEIKESVSIMNNIFKLFGCTRDNFKNVIISKEEFDFNEDNLERITTFVKLIEENVILVENVWISELEQESDNTDNGGNL